MAHYHMFLRISLTQWVNYLLQTSSQPCGYLLSAIVVTLTYPDKITIFYPTMQMTPSWAGVLIYLRVEGSTEGSGRAGSMGWGQLCEIQQGQVASPAPGSQQPHATLQAWGRVSGKLPGGKRPGVLVDSWLNTNQVAKTANSSLACLRN